MKTITCLRRASDVWFDDERRAARSVAGLNADAIVRQRTRNNGNDITPLLKKAGLDNADVKNYRPISNLSVVSQMLERVILQRLLEHLKANGLFPSMQSAYRKHHCTELHGDRDGEGAIGHPDGTRPWRRSSTGPIAYWTCLLRSTRSITASYSAVSANRTASAAYRSLGSVRT